MIGPFAAHWRGYMLMLAALAVAMSAAGSVRADTLSGEKIGVLLMHAKGASTRNIEDLGAALGAAGALVEMPEMPWSEDRVYDKGYEESMAEIDEHVARLKSDGAKRIVVAGHSIGANAALGYAARRDGIAGVVLLAFGHVPGNDRFAAKLYKSAAKAKAMIDAGKGEERAVFRDFGGNNDSASASANDLYSWFDSSGPATIDNNAPNVKPETPILCVDGAKDRNKRCSYIMLAVPANDLTRHVTVDATHRGTPSASSDAVIAWLRTLP